MAEFEKNIPPRIYHTNDPDGIFALWKQIVEISTDEEREYGALYQEIVDPDTAPIDFVELQLAQLGNPFRSVYLTEIQKRKLVRLLIPMYRQKGTKPGIVNAVRFLTGIEIEILDPHAGDSWDLGQISPYPQGQIGLNTFLGGTRFYKNMLDYSEAFNNVAWTKTLASVSPDVVIGPAPWGRPADQLVMTSAGATIRQAATPVKLAGKWFTGSVWLKAASAASLSGIVRVANNPVIDSTETVLNITTAWQRFVFKHKCLGGATGDVEFVLYSASGFAPNLYAFGGQLIRSPVQQPYWFRTNDGADEWELGKWGYHFIIQSPVVLTENQEEIISLVADFMKPAHTHYRIISPVDFGFIDHWEIGLSEIGIDNYVHD